ncbi:MAG: cyclic nucleotide-binding domain-containing protein [Chromatiales bacterium]|jgi:CRP-like cAMP-binding protein|nr:cyclic nucleotide-binding domain-containing protein [Chromatiales bacterium]
MAVTQPAVDKNLFNFNELSPLNQLTPTAIEALMAYARVERIPPGRRLFNMGESDGEAVFLLSGQLALIADGPTGVLKAAAPEARSAIADHQPRRHTAIAHTSATILSINAAVLDNLLKNAENPAGASFAAQRSDHSGDMSKTGTKVDVQINAGPLVLAPTAEVENTDEQASNIAAQAISAPTQNQTSMAGALPPSPLFEGLPSAHLQMLKQRLERIEIRRGETVAKAGEHAHHFHVIESGRLNLSRRRRHGSDVELTPGDSFGEDLLVVSRAHDATVIASEDSVLLRLPRPEFLALIAHHHMKWISARELTALLQDNRWLVLDVRHSAAYRRHHLHGSINLPLALLTGALRALDPEKRYVLCCDSPQQLATAIFLLARHGIKARALSDSVKAALSVN